MRARWGKEYEGLDSCNAGSSALGRPLGALDHLRGRAVDQRSGSQK